MSSVSVQFLIHVLPLPNCTILPVVLPLNITCLEVQVSVQATFTLYIMNYCNRSKIIITDLLASVSIDGMIISSLSNVTGNASLSSVTLTWTPQLGQLGSHLFCAVAYTRYEI